MTLIRFSETFFSQPEVFLARIILVIVLALARKRQASPTNANKSKTSFKIVDLQFFKAFGFWTQRFGYIVRSKASRLCL
jgi:hypothetical protein